MAGTPPIGPAIGLGAACRWMRGLDWAGAHEHEMALVQRVMDGLQKVDGTRLFGPAGLQNRYPVVSFTLEGVHPHDVAQMLDSFGVAVRAGTHCAEPLLARFGVTSTCRASFAMYNTLEEVDALAEALRKAREFFT